MKVRANGLSLPDLDTLAALETGRYWTPAKRPGEPLYRPAINNGYWAEDIITNGLVLNVPFWLYSGAKFPSVDAYHHTCIATDVTWGLQGQSFNGTSSLLSCGSTPILDTVFGGDTTGAYTYIWWAKHTTIDATARGLFVKGGDPKFWGMWVAGAAPNNTLYWEVKVVGGTNDLFVRWVINPATTAFSHYALVGSGRAASGWTLYKDCVALSMTITTDTLSGNVDNAGDNLYAPGRAWGASGYFLGIMGEARVYNREFTLAELTHDRNATRWKYS